MLKKRTFRKFFSHIKWLKVPISEVIDHQKLKEMPLICGNRGIKWSLERLCPHISYPLSFPGTNRRQPFII